MKKVIILFFSVILYFTSFSQSIEQPVAEKICLPCGGGGGDPPGQTQTIKCETFVNTVYVDGSRATQGDGRYWKSAFLTIQDALRVVGECPNVFNIKVAKGTYRPSTTVDANARDYNFFIGQPLNLLGGYPGGGGSDSNLQNFASNSTILDGEIQDLYESYHTLALYGITGNVYIEGFQIKNGFADGIGSVVLEPGVNMARNVGAAMYIRDVENIRIRNCVFYSNVANSNGGAIFSSGSNLFLENCVFVNNLCQGNGGAIYSQTASNTTLINCTFYYNYSPDAGEAIYTTTGSTLNALNCIVAGNPLAFAGGGTRNYSYCLLPGGSFSKNSFKYEPFFKNASDPDGPDNKWFTADDGLNLSICSPAINRGSNDIPHTFIKDITIRPRVFNGQIDMGAYEVQTISKVTDATMRSQNLDSSDIFIYSGVTPLNVIDNCRIIALLEPGTTGISTLGRFKAKTYIDAASLTYNDVPYVTRHYNIDDGLATQGNDNFVTLYFSNTDFTNYNLRSDVLAKLPLTTNLKDTANIRIYKFTGSSNSGDPGSYTGARTLVDTSSYSIKWNQTSLTWELRFLNTGQMGGYFITTALEYVFTGNGNWDVAANWLNNKIPPAILSPQERITIKDLSNAVLNVPQTLLKGAILNVRFNATLKIENTLIVEDDMKTRSGTPYKNHQIITGQ